MNPRDEMEAARSIWVFSWMIWHNTKSGQIDYSRLPKSFSIESERGNVAFKADIPASEREKLALNLVIAATGICFSALNSAMDRALGKRDDSALAPTTGLSAARVIVSHIRNAYAHDPIQPRWVVGNPNHQRTFLVDELGLAVDLRKLNGKAFNVRDVKGFAGLAELINYCINSVPVR